MATYVIPTADDVMDYNKKSISSVKDLEVHKVFAVVDYQYINDKFVVSLVDPEVPKERDVTMEDLPDKHMLAPTAFMSAFFPDDHSSLLSKKVQTVPFWMTVDQKKQAQDSKNWYYPVGWMPFANADMNHFPWVDMVRRENGRIQMEALAKREELMEEAERHVPIKKHRVT